MATGTDELYSGVKTLHRSQPFLDRAESSSAAGTTYPDGKMETGLTAQAGRFRSVQLQGFNPATLGA